jgi:uncharacterized membrane protein
MADKSTRGRGSSPTFPPRTGLARALERNIDALVARRKSEERSALLEERLAAAITRFAGSMLFVYIHAVIFGLWIVVNVGWLPVIPAWDSSLVVLAMVASVEAIFLSTFVLISQNRMAAEDDKRADLNLQVSLLNEHETTRLLKLVEEIATRVGATIEDDDGEIEELKRDVAPEAVLDRIEEKNEAVEER